MTLGDAPRYSVVVPVYNSVTSLGELARRVDAVFTEVVKASYEIVFVDDGSPNPKTWPALEEVWESLDTVRVLRLSRNFGQQAATLCGIAEARGEHILTMDDDLQHPPEEIPALLAEEQHDIVIAQLQERKHAAWKRATSWLKGYFDQWVLGKPPGLRLSSFRLFNRMVADGIQRISTPYPFLPALLFHVSKDVVGVPVRHEARKEGRGNYGMRQLFKLFSNLIISNSSLLLRLVGSLGLAFAVVSIGMAGYFTVRKLALGTSATGWTSLIVAILLVGGLVMFALGIIGEYLIRIIAGTENKPTYFIRVSRPARAALDAAPVEAVSVPRRPQLASGTGRSGC